MSLNASISYLVPAFNEVSSIEDTILEIQKLTPYFHDFEVVLVNDGSTDGTKEIVEKLANQYDFLTAIHHETNKGFGASYRTAFTNANCTYCMLVPGDNAHPSDTLVPILQSVGTADIVIPYVLNPEARSKTRQIVSSLFVLLVNLLMNLRIPYYNGLVVHRTELLKKVNPKTSGFAYQAEILVKLVKSGASYVTVPTKISERITGKTGAFTVKNVYKVLMTLLHLTRVFWLTRNSEMKELREHLTKT